MAQTFVGIGVSHDRRLFRLIIILLLLFIGMIYVFSVLYGDASDGSSDPLDDYVECARDADCVPATCCHPDSCVSLGEAPDCAAIFCTEECRGGTLDCGQGSCFCVEGTCRAVIDDALF